MRPGADAAAMTEPYPQHKRGRVAFPAAVLLLAAAILAAYSNHFQNGFHFDDSHTIVDNAAIRSLGNIPRFFKDAATFSVLPANQSYRPVVSATLAVDYWLGKGLKPFWFQLSDFAWFLLQTGLLGLVIFHLLSADLGTGARNRWLALGAAGLFGLHPANADTVNYIIARSDLISTAGIVAGLAIYICQPGLRRRQVHLLPVAIGILAKPVAAIYAPLLLVYMLLFPDASTRGRPVWNQVATTALRSLPAFVVCGGMAALVSWMTPREWVGGAAEPGHYIMTQPYVALLYLKQFLWPRGLSADYDLAAISSEDWRLWAGAGFTGIWTMGAVWAAFVARTRVIGFGMLWFLLALLPTSLTPLAEVMNDHRAFFPYMGLVIALAGAGAILMERFQSLASAETWMGAAAVAVMAACGAGTYLRNEVWRDDETLWADTARKSPGNGRALMNYGNALMAKGRLPEALEEFRKARQAAPAYSYVYVNLGVAEGALGDEAQAEQDFRTALRLGPNTPPCLSFYAEWLLAHGRPGEASPLAERALELAPGDLKIRDLVARTRQALAMQSPEVYLQQSLDLYRSGKFKEAIAAAEQALRLRPNYAEAYNNIGAAWNSLGDYRSGAAACEEALKIKPQWMLARNNLLYALSMARRQTEAAKTPETPPGSSR